MNFGYWVRKKLAVVKRYIMVKFPFVQRILVDIYLSNK